MTGKLWCFLVRGVGIVCFHYNSLYSQIQCVYITTHGGFDHAVSIPVHIHLVALCGHNTTAIQLVLFTVFGVIIEHYKTKPLDRNILILLIHTSI